MIFLRGVIPPALLHDLRRETDKAREIARRLHGPQAQRLQPLAAYDELDQRAFRDFADLPALRTAVERLLGANHRATGHMGVLFEPAEHPWTTGWHRDGYTLQHVVDDLDAYYHAVTGSLGMFNQLNAALYDDHSFWVVPGSHNRRDNEAEAVFAETLPIRFAQLPEEWPDERRELAINAYCRSLEGAQQIVLKAGDVAFYRNPAWHLGAYVPYVKRATLHEGYRDPADPTTFYAHG